MTRLVSQEFIIRLTLALYLDPPDEVKGIAKWFYDHDEGYREMWESFFAGEGE